MHPLATLRQSAFAIAMVAFLGSASAASSVERQQALIGQPAPAGASARVVDLNATRHANIAYGETVIFRGNGGNQFAWTFNGIGGRSWDLAQFAPAGFTSKDYRVYVSSNPLYRR